MRRNPFVLCVIALLLCVAGVFSSAISGCGSGGSSDAYPGATSPPLPMSAGVNQYRPNYCSDLTGMYYFEQETITYRIMGGFTASAINLARIPCQDATEVQAGDIRNAFKKIEAAIGGSRKFQEVPASDGSAAIDVVVQNQEQFGSVGEGTSSVRLGRTDLWYPGGRNTPVIRRAVVRLMADQPERSLRRTILHECMHAVGLWGHSRHFGDILVPVSLPIIPEIELSEYDANTLRANYDRLQVGQDRTSSVSNRNAIEVSEACAWRAGLTGVRKLKGMSVTPHNADGIFLNSKKALQMLL